MYKLRKIILLTIQDDSPAELHFVDLTIFSNTKCKKIYRSEITNNEVCAGISEGGKGQCNVSIRLNSQFKPHQNFTQYGQLL